MIRANLLPRPKERIGIAGLDLDADIVRQLAYGFAIVAIVAGIGVGIALLRVERLRAAVGEADALIASHASKRAQIKALAQDVARYQGFSREAEAYGRSGSDVAIAIARIGNSVPNDAWLDALSYAGGGYQVIGSASTVETLGATVLALGSALPESRATLVNIDNHGQERGDVRFTARVATGPAETAAGAP